MPIGAIPLVITASGSSDGQPPPSRSSSGLTRLIFILLSWTRQYKKRTLTLRKPVSPKEQYFRLLYTGVVQTHADKIHTRKLLPARLQQLGRVCTLFGARALLSPSILQFARSARCCPSRFQLFQKFLSLQKLPLLFYHRRILLEDINKLPGPF